jgi:hypothetical protein
MSVPSPASASSELTENGLVRGTLGANVLTLDAKKAAVAPAQRPPSMRDGHEMR